MALLGADTPTASQHSVLWDADSFDLIESRPADGMAFGRDGEGVERDGAMEEGSGALYAPSPVVCGDPGRGLRAGRSQGSCATWG